MANSKISALPAASTPLAGTEVLPIVQSSVTDQVSVANLTAGRAVSAASLTLTTTPLGGSSGGTGVSSFTANGVPYASSTTALATGSALTFDGTSTFKLTAAGTGYVYAYNSTAATSSVTQSSPRVGFYGAQWNSGTGNVAMSGYLQLQALTSNVASPTSKLSVYVAANGGTPGEVAYFDSNSNVQTYGNLVNTNSTAATSGSAPASYKFYLYRNSWNSSFGSLAQTNYIYAKNVTNNANPTTEAIVIAPADGTSSQTANEAFEFRGTGDFKMVSGNIRVGTSGKGVTTDGSFSLGLGTNGSTSQVNIDTSGNLIVNSATANAKANVKSNAQSAIYTYTSGAGYGLYIEKDYQDGSYVAFKYNNTVTGTIDTTNGTNTNYNTSSDYRLKTLIAPVSNAGQRLDALKPIEFEWKVNNKRARGFFAHEFQEIYPDSVSGAKDAVDQEGNPMYQAMQASTAEVIADLVAEIQSLRLRVAALEK